MIKRIRELIFKLRYRFVEVLEYNRFFFLESFAGFCSLNKKWIDDYYVSLTPQEVHHGEFLEAL